MKRITLLIVSLLSLLLLSPAVSYAFEPFKDACANNPKTSSGQTSAVCTTNQTTNPLSGPNGLLIKAADLIALIGGVAAVIIIIIGGLQYILSTGDSARTNSAKNTILYALIGLVVIVVARTLIAYVIDKL